MNFSYFWWELRTLQFCPFQLNHHNNRWRMHVSNFLFSRFFFYILLNYIKLSIFRTYTCTVQSSLVFFLGGGLLLRGVVPIIKIHLSASPVDRSFKTVRHIEQVFQTWCRVIFKEWMEKKEHVPTTIFLQRDKKHFKCINLGGGGCSVNYSRIYVFRWRLESQPSWKAADDCTEFCAYSVGVEAFALVNCFEGMNVIGGEVIFMSGRIRNQRIFRWNPSGASFTTVHYICLFNYAVDANLKH